jgi:glycosyltransferase involved in cell wall biosynthesis
MFVLDSSVRALISKAETALGRGSINIALCCVHDFVERIITEPICTAQVFASHDLDQLCLRIGRQNLASLTAPQDDFWPGRKNGVTVVYLVSRLQRSGGHSRLVQDFIRAQPEKNHLILSTEIGGPSDKDYFSQLFSKYENVRFMRTPRRDFEARLNWLQSILLTCRPEHVYLFNHHQDSVAVAALVPELGLNGSFIHHGDHHLCLGVHLSHLAHVDLHPMGYHHCRDELGVNNRYLPLTFEDKHCLSVQTDFSQGGPLTTATAARSNKIEIPYYVSYLDTIPAVLKVTGGKHVHIGKLTPWALRRVYSQMRKQGVQKDRFVYLEWTPSVWKALQEHRVDVYIASFPYGAGLTLIEAMGAGVPVIMHQHMYSRVLSGLELVYPEAYCWSAPNELMVYLSALRPESLERERQLARQQYERFHRPEILQNYLSSSIPNEVNLPPLAENFQPRWDEWAAWAEAQLSASHWIYRFAYRTFRSVRARLYSIFLS